MSCQALLAAQANEAQRAFRPCGVPAFQTLKSGCMRRWCGWWMTPCGLITPYPSLQVLHFLIPVRLMGMRVSSFRIAVWLSFPGCSMRAIDSTFTM